MVVNDLGRALDGSESDRTPAQEVVDRIRGAGGEAVASYDDVTSRRSSSGLGSADSAGVTGRVFEVEGGAVSVADGWQHGPRVDRGRRWEPAELEPAVRGLLAKAPPAAPVYGATVTSG